MSDPTTRISLILRLRNPQDSVAWDEFSQIYTPLIRRIATNMGMSAGDADDACQEVLIRLSKVIDQWKHQRPDANFRGWLFRVSKNTFLKFVRSNSRYYQRFTQLEFDSVPNLKCKSQEGCYFDVEFAKQLLSEAMHRIQGEFSTKNWQAFWCSYIEMQSIDATAEQLNMKKNQVYVARSRVVKRLRKEVQHLTSGDESVLTDASIFIQSQPKPNGIPQ